MKKCALIMALFIMGLVLSGCPFNLADVQFLPAEMNTAASTKDGFTLAEAVKLDDLPCGFSRTLRPGTAWVPVGEVPRGTVFRSRDQQLTLECSNVFQAYLVVSEKKLVGFFLPVEKGFVALEKPVLLPTKS